MAMPDCQKYVFNTLRSDKKTSHVPLEKVALQHSSFDPVFDDYEQQELIEKALAIVMNFDEREWVRRIWPIDKTGRGYFLPV